MTNILDLYEHNIETFYYVILSNSIIVNDINFTN